MIEKPKIVILCGGMGTRLRDYSDPVPKALVRIGDMPIIWHVMKIYSYYGYKDFILCVGFKGDHIRRYFLDFQFMINDFTLNLKSKEQRVINHGALEDWSITLAETGLNTKTGKRIKLIEKYIDTDNFFCTYTDGLSNVNINKLYEFHKKMNKTATATVVNPFSPFGKITEENGIVTSFSEKPKLKGLINGGFFMFNKKIFDYLKEDIFLEEEPIKQLTVEKQLAAYFHNDFWTCVDTFKDVERLNKMYEKKNTPWMIWKKGAI